MKHIVSISGGIASFATAKRVVEKFGPDNTVLLFADTKMEDEDLYRFLDEGTKYLKTELITLTEGRDVWEVFHDHKFLGNSRVDICSKYLKRDLLKKWIKERYKPEEMVMYVGLDWTEGHRIKNIKRNWLPYQVEAPLTWNPIKSKPDLFEDLKTIKIEPPRLYAMGFPHNNCGGFCIKAGKANFANLLKQMPERYAYHEKKEEEMRKYLDKNVSILRDRRKGKTKPLTLKKWREEIETNPQMSFMDKIDWGGCGCAI